MKKYIFVIIPIIIILLLLVYKYGNTSEHFGDPVSLKKTIDVLDLSNQFDDIIEYQNEPDGRIGLDKCIENCNGYCVEFGMTGDAHCFPVRPYEEKDFYGMIVQNDRKLSFPNIDRTDE